MGESLGLEDSRGEVDWGTGISISGELSAGQIVRVRGGGV